MGLKWMGLEDGYVMDWGNFHQCVVSCLQLSQTICQEILPNPRLNSVFTPRLYTLFPSLSTLPSSKAKQIRLHFSTAIIITPRRENQLPLSTIISRTEQNIKV